MKKYLVLLILPILAVACRDSRDVYSLDAVFGQYLRARFDVVYANDSERSGKYDAMQALWPDISAKVGSLPQNERIEFYLKVFYYDWTLDTESLWNIGHLIVCNGDYREFKIAMRSFLANPEGTYGRRAERGKGVIGYLNSFRCENDICECTEE